MRGNADAGNRGFFDMQKTCFLKWHGIDDFQLLWKILLIPVSCFSCFSWLKINRATILICVNPDNLWINNFEFSC